MKKFLVILLVLALLAGLAYGLLYTFVLSPKIDNLEDTKELLEEAGYTVSYYNNESDDRQQTLELLNAYKRSEDEDDDSFDGLNVTVYESKELAKIEYEKIKFQLDMMKKQYELQIDSLEYEIDNNDKLTDEQIEDYKEDIENCKKQLEQYKEFRVGRTGNVVWYGTKDAIKATRG